MPPPWQQRMLAAEARWLFQLLMMTSVGKRPRCRATAWGFDEAHNNGKETRRRPSTERRNERCTAWAETLWPIGGLWDQVFLWGP